MTEKPFFREAFKRTRCLIPVSGYYEWEDTPGGKQPWYFTACDGSPASAFARFFWKSASKMCRPAGFIVAPDFRKSGGGRATTRMARRPWCYAVISADTQGAIS